MDEKQALAYIRGYLTGMLTANNHDNLSQTTREDLIDFLKATDGLTGDTYRLGDYFEVEKDVENDQME